MELRQKVVVITGGGNGIGAALAYRAAREGAAGVAVADLDGTAAAEVARRVQAETGVPTLSTRTDVSREDEVKNLVAQATEGLGPIDVFISNAGVNGGAGLFADEGAWDRAWAVNVKAHVYAARAVIPGMLRRRTGAFVSTISAAGLLTLGGDAPYSTTKHAAIGFSEWLACTYSPRGLYVAAICPMGVWTEMLREGVERGHPSARAIAAQGAILTAEEVADSAIRGMAEERFLILPHEEVAEMYAGKAADIDGWISRTAASLRSGKRSGGPRRRAEAEVAAGAGPQGG